MDQTRSNEIRSLIFKFGTEDVAAVLSDVVAQNGAAPAKRTRRASPKKPAAKKQPKAQPRKRGSVRKRAVPKPAAKRRKMRDEDQITADNNKVLSYIKRHPGKGVADIYPAIKMDPYLVTKAVKDLRAGRKIKAEGKGPHTTYTAK